MSTTAYIVNAKSETELEYIYLHSDGYPEHAGQILFEHYGTPEQVQALVDLGDLSFLAPNTERPSGHSWAKPVPGYCIAYGRDRGEQGCQKIVVNDHTEIDDRGMDYVYVYANKQWHVYHRGLMMNWEPKQVESTKQIGA